MMRSAGQTGKKFIVLLSLIFANYERKGLRSLRMLFVDERAASATRQNEEETDLGNNTKRSYEKERWSRWSAEEI